MSLVKANGAGDQSTGFYNDVIDQSLRFNSASSAYLQDTASGTPSSTTNRAVSFWVKRSILSTTQQLLTGQVSGPNVTDFINFRSDDTIMIYVDLTAGGSDETNWQTTAKFRDVGSWYHIFVKYTLSESSNANKVKLYVNGSQQTLTATQTGNAVTSSRLLTNGTTIKISNYYDNRYYLDGYLAEYNVIDGDADHTDFGETVNGVWIAKAYSGSYGNSGFRLTFEATGTGTTADGTDNSSNMTNIGDDKSGNANNFAVYNLGSHDKVPDTPENNFATFNTLTGHSATTMSEGNLRALGNNSSNILESQSSTIGVTSGKWYAEFRADDLVNDSQDNGTQIGVTTVPYNRGSGNQNGYVVGNTRVNLDQSGGAYLGVDQDISTAIGSYADGDIIGVALNVDDSEVSFTKNGSAITNATDASINPQNDLHFFEIQLRKYDGDTSQITANFGQDSTFAGAVSAGGNTDGNGKGDFKYSVPSGYLALCSANLPNVTIGPSRSSQADDHFDTITYSGSASNQTITTNFQADWLWFKERTTDGIDHNLFDSSRLHSTSSAKFGKKLESNSTDVEADSTAIVSQSTNDITLLGGVSTTNDQYSRTYVMWHWKANGGTLTTNDASATGVGTIDSQYQANTTAGFSIVTYTGDGNSSGTIAHGLNSAPEWVLIFGRNVSNSQMLGVTPIGFTKYASFQTTGGYFVADSTIWNNTAPTSTVFSVGGAANVNDAYNYVAYCFHSVEGYSKIGTYSGDGNTSSDGPYVYLGFRPAWLFVKRTNNTGGAIIWDNKRSTSNPTDDYLVPQSTNNEDTNSSTQRVDFLSNGFKVRNGATSNSINGSGSTYLYLAFAEQPFKFSNAR
jgi:hypothetical protein